MPQSGRGKRRWRFPVPQNCVDVGDRACLSGCRLGCLQNHFVGEIPALPEFQVLSVPAVGISADPHGLEDVADQPVVDCGLPEIFRYAFQGDQSFPAERIHDGIHFFQRVPVVFEAVIGNQQQGVFPIAAVQPAGGIVVHNRIQHFIVNGKRFVDFYREFVNRTLVVEIILNLALGKTLVRVQFGDEFIQLGDAAFLTFPAAYNMVS